MSWYCRCRIIGEESRKEAEENISEIQAKTTVLRFAGLYTAQSLNRLRDPLMRKS